MTELVEASQDLIEVVRPAGTEFTRVEIPAEDIIDGHPFMEMGPIWTSNDGSKMHGISRMAPGRFWFNQPFHETTHLLRGRMTITLPGGHEIALQAGDVVHMQPGARWDLTVIEPVEDSWTVTSSDGPVSI